MSIIRGLNLGCGNRFHADWLNLDIRPVHPSVTVHDLRRPIPSGGEAFDVVYHSHVLEHFRRSDAKIFLDECWRVLKVGGVLRVVVPDLERIAQDYIHALNRAANEEPGSLQDHEWMTLELYDQTVRENSGGQMKAYLADPQIQNKEFVVGRLGVQARRAVENAQRRSVEAAQPSPSVNLGRRAWRWMKSRFRVSQWREAAIACLLGPEVDALNIGRFRLAGEVHQWMYDRVSLKRLFQQVGFRDIVVRKADESYVADWSQFGLDTEPDGSVYKPDSIFMEGLKSR